MTAVRAGRRAGAGRRCARRGGPTQAALLAAGAVLAGCSSAWSGDAAAPTSPRGSASGQGELTVLAAASLKTAFTELGALFRRAAADDLLAGAAQPFATNTMMIAVPPGNPAKITAFADLAGEAVIVVVCAPQVPCGAATEQVEANTGVALSPVSEEGSVTDVLGKVSSGQADAGVVYVTDVTAAGEAVQGVAIPADANATSTYPVAVLAGSRDQALAGRFRDLVLSAHGQQVLADAGFGAP